MTAPFEIDPDIRVAHTPPGEAYCDRALYEQVKGRIFARTWHIVADQADARIPGQVYPLRFLPGSVDEPLVLTRDREDTMHCMSNVCTHRGNVVALGPCQASYLRCRYHGRRFGLDGSFEHMPEFEQTQGFPSEADCLPKVPFITWRQFVFASLDPAMPFDEVIGDVERRVGWMPIESFRFDPARSRDYLVESNWALYCDNYLEGFHIPFVHASLNTQLDYGKYATETFRYANLQIGISSGGEDVFDLPADSPDHGKQVAGYFYWLFPCTMLNFYPWGLSVNMVQPLALDRTRICFRAYVWDESKLSRGAGAELDRVEREDEAVVEETQRGVGSRLYTRGRYSPTREQCVHHFHRLLTEFLWG